jgi:hypothetical protein
MLSEEANPMPFTWNVQNGKCIEGEERRRFEGEAGADGSAC